MFFIKTKKIFLNVFLLSILIIFNACGDSHMGNVSITGEKEKIEYIVLNNTENGSLLEDINEIFSFAFEGGNSKNIQKIKIGDEIMLDFGSNPPDKLSINDGLLNSNGNFLYKSKVLLEVPYYKKKGKYSFKLEKHIESRLSSYSWEDKAEYRGFIIGANWGDIEYKYAFVIESNPL